MNTYKQRIYAIPTAVNTLNTHNQLLSVNVIDNMTRHTTLQDVQRQTKHKVDSNAQC